MISAIRSCFVIVAFVIVSTGIAQGSPLDPLDIQMTIDAIDDAGQFAGQPAYVKFVVDPSGVDLATITTAEVSNRWTSSTEVKSYADNNIPGAWFLQSAGNIWSSDTIVGDALTGLDAGVYRISALGGAFTYDSFDWSGVADKWLWQLQIYAVGIDNYSLGSDVLYDTKALALAASLGTYKDITLAEGGELIFWIADGSLNGNPNQRNTIDNSGSLIFNVTEIPPAVPEPATLMLIGTGLFVLVRRFRGALVPLN